MKTAVSYIRVSTKEQAERDGDPEGYSIPAQRDANQRKAASMGAAIVAEFVDRGESARSADRPELQKMLRYVATTPTDYVIVHKVDRLARNRVDDVTINLELRKTGSVLVSATENIDETASGMLLHGIMSSIAEFYSRNLATEVLKGMEQKAKTGGTPGKAPLGYRNVSGLNADGREIRTVAVDPERGPLITWAFQAYATGDWTLKQLTAALESRGLTTVPTPKRPAQPIKFNSLHRILTTPYYKGDVTYRGVQYPGRHQPLIDPVTWAQVQDILASHATGEKQREHPHYLKSTVYCGGCGSRLIVTMAKNHYGAVYPYFICLGRHEKLTNCTRKAVPIAVVEDLVAAEYRAIQLTPEAHRDIEAILREDLQATHARIEAERRDLATQQERLTNERTRLLQAHYVGAIPLDLLKEEQGRIARQLATVAERLEAIMGEFSVLEQHLQAALDYASNCYRGYVAASHHVRRLYNQAFFERIYVDEDTIRVELREPFQTLLAEHQVDSPALPPQHDDRTHTSTQRLGATRPRRHPRHGNKKTSDRVEGLNEHCLVPPAGIEPAT
ncbi:recombinase family protein [Rhodococcus sp. GG48]|nr:recombinase family protein [Rhodococcus sp. GG48]